MQMLSFLGGSRRRFDKGVLSCCIWLLAFVNSIEAANNEDPSLVSPIVNRELESSVVAHSWPFTVHNVFCEAWAFHQQEKQSWSFLDVLVNDVLQQDDITKLSSSAVSDDMIDVVKATKLVLEATEHKSDKSFLDYALSLRAYSPQCELHRGLARQLGLTQQVEKTDAFAVVYPGGDIVVDPKEIDDYLSHSVVEDSPVVPSDTLLPGETPRPTGSSSSDGELQEGKPLIVLYANIGSESFVTFYSKLVKENVQFVVRHMGAVDFEEKGGAPTILQGYGVRLDIRNVEYRAFDDAPRGSESVKELLDPSSIEDVMVSSSFAGVNMSVIAEGLTPKEAVDTQEKLWKRHGAQQLHSQTIPPTWQRREISLQAAAVVAKTASSSEKDSLVTLQDVSQNLPSIASTLVHVQVPDDIANAAQTLTDMGLFRGSKQHATVMINGQSVSVDRPSFNVFEMLNLLRKEQRELQDMQTYLSPSMNFKTMQRVQDLWTMGEDAFKSSESNDNFGGMDGMEEDGASNVFRIDVGRGWKNAVIYLNDVEKDMQYSQWPRELQQMMFGLQFGQPPAVRRNLFTILGVVDPVTDPSNSGITLGLQLTNQMYPIRIGLLFVSEEDIATCTKWVVENGITDDDPAPCPVSPIFTTSGKPAQTELQEMKASTQAVYKLLSYISSKHSDEMWPLHYGSNLLNFIEEYMESNGKCTMDSLLTMHSNTMTSIDAPHSIPSGIDILSSADDNDSPSYGQAVRFAVKKALQPGMSFVNGRPLPSEAEDSSHDKSGRVFMEERNHLFQMIAKQEITDRSPKSVYAKLLSGGGVFKRVHPLLTGSNQKKYIRLSHDLDSKSLIVPETQSSVSKEDSQAVFLIEAALELDTESGMELASSFITMMNEFPSSVGEEQSPVSISIAYRILPSTKASAATAVYKILRHAAHFSATTLLSLLQLSKEGKSISEIVESVPGIDEDLKKVLLSTHDASETRLSYLENSFPSKNFVVANGRAYFLDTPVITKDDIELLLDMDMAKNKAIHKLLKPHLTVDEMYHDAMGKASSFLLEQDGSSQRQDTCGEVANLEQDMQMENPLRFEWNNEETEELKVKVCAIVDPLTEATQRAAPLLRAFRDQLKLPLSLIVIPRILLEGDDDIPITSYYRFVAEPNAIPNLNPPQADFSNLPANHLLTLRLDVPEPWIVVQTETVQDTDNLRCDVNTGCSDEAHTGESEGGEKQHLTRVEYGLTGLSFFGQCYDSTSGSPPNGLQLTLSKANDLANKSGTPEMGEIEISADGSTKATSSSRNLAISSKSTHYSDTLVMKTVGYWQLRANPGVWKLEISKDSRGAEIFDIVDGSIQYGKFKLDPNGAKRDSKTLVMKDFVNRGELLLVKRRPGLEKASLFYDEQGQVEGSQGDVIHVFSLATGHLYERFLKIMMLSVTKRTSSKVKFWLFENFLSPSFKASAMAMAEKIGCEVEFVTYKWPEWLRGQSEKQRIIWGYKILFLDVLFPLDVKKIIYVDADQVIRGDLKELWDMDLQGAPYGYTPMCSSRESTLGYAFWRTGFWESHLRGKPYHISALYVVDLEKFRRDLVGDKLRSTYQQLSADPNSLANLDQDLPNYAQHQVPIFSLPQEWLWCESWCSDETKALAKTIDLCNNPLHKEAKLSMAKRVISGELFAESWEELDAEVEKYNLEFQESLGQ